VFTDPTALTSRAYNEQGPLAARLAIYDYYQRDKVDLPGVALEALASVRGTVLAAARRTPRPPRPAARPVRGDGAGGGGRRPGEPVVAFVDSMRGLAEADLPPGVSWETVLERVRARVADEIDRAGVWRMHSHVGVLTGR
jgi:hypothetical protein